MSSASITRIRRVSEELITSLAWAQWARLSSLVTKAELRASAIIDPEVLLLTSAIGSRYERRLIDAMESWLGEGYRFVSTQRTRTLATRLAEPHRQALGITAVFASRAGDHRWKAMASGPTDANLESGRGKSLGPLRIDEPPALMLRLRAGFGMGTKADLLAYLIGVGKPVPLRSIADNVGYGSRALRMALEDMVLAGFVGRVGTSPSEYKVQAGQWQSLLNSGYNGVQARDDFTPRWLPWADVMTLFSHIIAWAIECEQTERTSYVAASRFRDLLKDYLTPYLLKQFPISPPGPVGRPEIDVFEQFVIELEATIRGAA